MIWAMAPQDCMTRGKPRTSRASSARRAWARRASNPTAPAGPLERGAPGPVRRAACGSRWLVDFYAMLLDRNARYRYLAFADASVPRDAAAEHQAITDAVLARDSDRAVAAAEAHIRVTAETVAASYISAT